MSDDVRFDVILAAIQESDQGIPPDAANALATHVLGSLYAFESQHASDRSLGVRRWDIKSHESLLRYRMERKVMDLPSDGPFVHRDAVLRVVKGSDDV